MRTGQDTTGPACAGIDWGGAHHQLCVVDDRGRRLGQLRFPHDVAGLADLDTELTRHGDVLPVAVERSEGLLVEHLQARGHPVFPVSPRTAARARERYRVAAVNDDRFDAFVLADTLRYEHEHWRPLAVPSPLLAEIKALTRDRDRLLQTPQTIEAQLRLILETYHPAPVRLFSSVDRQITLHFVLDYPTPATASRVTTTRMQGPLSRHAYTGRVPAQVLAERLRANLLSAMPGTAAGKSFSAQAFTRLLQQRNGQLGEYDDAIAAAVAEHPDTSIVASFPGVGPVLTGVLLAETGKDRTRFPRAEVLLAEADLAPVTRSSGRSCNVRFRYAANTRLREASMWWAYNQMKQAPWAAAAFRDARDHRGQHYHRALRNLAARWMRLLRTCWASKTPDDPSRHATARAALTAAGDPGPPSRPTGAGVERHLAMFATTMTAARPPPTCPRRPQPARPRGGDRPPDEVVVHRSVGTSVRAARTTPRHSRVAGPTMLLNVFLCSRS